MRNSDVIPNILFPPPLRRAPSRLKKNRKRQSDEGPPALSTNRFTTLRYVICLSFEHNKRTCKGGPTYANRATTSAAIRITNKFTL